MTEIVTPATEEATLREVVEALAPLERRAGSPGERQAAEWLAERLQSVVGNARVEEEQFLDGYAPLMTKLSAARRRRRRRGAAEPPAARLPAAVVGAAAAAAIADDISNGPRVARKATQQPKPTWNVVAEAGDLSAQRTLVLLAHHDAAPTGKFFESPAQEWAGRALPRARRAHRHIAAAVVARRRRAGAGRLRRAHAASAGSPRPAPRLSAFGAGVFADIARSPIVPGANDNLSGCAVLVGLAERLRERPVDGLRLLLVSCGAEEVIQGGIYGFMERHRPELDREQTYFLNFDTVGSPELVMVEGEGPMIMEDNFYRPFRDLCARAAERADAPFRRGMRARNSTDSVIVSRAGYPIATFASIEPLQGAVELPPDVRYAREPRLRHGRARGHRRRGRRARAPHGPASGGSGA